MRLHLPPPGPKRDLILALLLALAAAAPSERIGGSLAALASAAGLPRLLLRVHDVAATVQYLAVAREIALRRRPR